MAVPRECSGAWAAVLANAYMAAVSTSCMQIVRSVLLTQPGQAQRALAGTTVQESDARHSL